jgi:hypothetical protein
VLTGGVDQRVPDLIVRLLRLLTSRIRASPTKEISLIVAKAVKEKKETEAKVVVKAKTDTKQIKEK